jgi:hypothetical protein
MEFVVDKVALECSLKWGATHCSCSTIISGRKDDMTGNVRVNVTTRRVSEIIVVVEKQKKYYIF